MTTRVDYRSMWMARFEDGVLTLRPDFKGRIDWDTATHLYRLLPTDPMLAAARYVTVRKLAEPA